MADCGGMEARIPTMQDRPGFGPVTINQVSNGFMAAVGCKTFVFKTVDEVVDALRLYYKNPGEARKKYCKDEEIV